MIEIIEEIVRAEEEAESIVQTARTKAAEEKRAAEEALAAKLANARSSAKDEAQKRIETSRRELETSTEPPSNSGEDASQFLTGHESVVTQLVDEVVEIVLSTPLEQP